MHDAKILSAIANLSNAEPGAGYIPLPLYHGTSSIWRESILEHGLGGRNIVSEMRAVQFLREANALAKSFPEVSRPPIAELMDYDSTAQQRITGAGFNYRHGSVYLSICRTTAEWYARSNGLGSEALSQCLRLYQCIVKHQDGRIPDWMNTYPELLKTFNLHGSPILLRVDDVQFSEVVAENGGDSYSELKLLLDARLEAASRRAVREDARKAFLAAAAQGDGEAVARIVSQVQEHIWTDDKIVEVFGQQMNFESITVFPASLVTFEECSAAAD